MAVAKQTYDARKKNLADFELEVFTLFLYVCLTRSEIFSLSLSFYFSICRSCSLSFSPTHWTHICVCWCLYYQNSLLLLLLFLLGCWVKSTWFRIDGQGHRIVAKAQEAGWPTGWSWVCVWQCANDDFHYNLPVHVKHACIRVLVCVCAQIYSTLNLQTYNPYIPTTMTGIENVKRDRDCILEL